MADFDEMWEKLERKGWEVTHHGEKQRTRWLLPRGVECDPGARHHTYIQQLAMDGQQLVASRSRFWAL
jgi:hypothetical protein